jgi:hypothetical protein
MSGRERKLELSVSFSQSYSVSYTYLKTANILK